MGQKIGKYEIAERIGRGAMGVVYRAHDPVLARPVALKVISDEIEVTDELRARFFREAQACAKLSHPNIVTIYDMGEAEGRLYIVMELLQGRDLRHVIAERHPMTLEDKLDLMIQVCAGLHYAHARGVIHRDVKPANIIVQPDGVAKLVDFGVARLGDSSEGLTRTGLLMGSLRYVAPEQARGRADARSDMFSAGAVFFELLSYRPAFPASDPMQLLEQLRSEDPRALTDIDPEIPAAVSDAVQRALRKVPADRFPDVGRMRAEFQAVHKQRAAETLQAKARLDATLARIRSLQSTLTASLGSAPTPQSLPVADERDGLSRLLTAERLALEAVARLEERVGRAQAPTVEEAPAHPLSDLGRDALPLSRDARRQLDGDTTLLGPAAGAPRVANTAAPAKDATVIAPSDMPRSSPVSRRTPPAAETPSGRRPRVGIATGLAAAVAIAVGLYAMYPSPPAGRTTEARPAPPPQRETTPPETRPGAPDQAAPNGAPPASTQSSPPTGPGEPITPPAPALPSEPRAEGSATLPPRSPAPPRRLEPAEPLVRRGAESAPSRPSPEARGGAAAPRTAEDARELRTRVHDLRRAAEFVDAATFAPDLWARAQALHQQGDAAFERGDLGPAATHWRSAIRAYRDAAGEASEHFKSQRSPR